MKKLFLIACCLQITTVCCAQNFVTEITEKREQQYSQEYANYWRYDEVCDTLLLEDGTPVLLLRTPIRYLKGYTELFCTYGKTIFDFETVIANHSGLGARGYFMTWRLKDKNLYLEKVWWTRLEWYDLNIDGLRLGPDVSQEEIKKRVELLTSRKFDEDGLLFADWVTDRILVVKYHPYRLTKEKRAYIDRPLTAFSQSKAYLSKVADTDIRDDSFVLHRSQKIFALDFMQGKLRNIYECTNINQEQMLNDLHTPY